MYKNITGKVSTYIGLSTLHSVHCFNNNIRSIFIASWTDIWRLSLMWAWMSSLMSSISLEVSAEL